MSYEPRAMSQRAFAHRSPLLLPKTQNPPTSSLLAVGVSFKKFD